MKSNLATASIVAMILALGACSASEKTDVKAEKPAAEQSAEASTTAVSYTHLTLPTIPLV